MIQSDLLKEKYRIQERLSRESASIHEYLERSQLAASAIASSYGFSLQYVEAPNNKLQATAKSAPPFPLRSKA